MTKKTKCKNCGREYDIPDNLLSVNCACGAKVENIKPKKQKISKKKKGRKKK